MGSPRSSRVRGSGGEAPSAPSSSFPSFSLPFLLPHLPSTLFPAPLPPLPVPTSTPVSAVTSEARSPSLLGRKVSFGDRKSAILQFSLGTQYNIYCKRSCSVSLLTSWCLRLVGEQGHREEVL